MSFLLAACANPFVPRDAGPSYQGVRDNRPSRLVVGNYCGIRTRQGNLSVAPVDALDAACLDHDACFIAGRDRRECNRADRCLRGDRWR